MTFRTEQYRTLLKQVHSRLTVRTLIDHSVFILLIAYI